MAAHTKHSFEDKRVSKFNLDTRRKIRSETRRYSVAFVIWASSLLRNSSFVIRHFAALATSFVIKTLPPHRANCYT